MIIWYNLFHKTSPFSFFFLVLDYARIQSAFSLCKTPSSNKDIHQLNGFLRNAFTLLAMMDYPYDTSFMSKMPAFPVKVQHFDYFLQMFQKRQTYQVTNTHWGNKESVVYHGLTISLFCLSNMLKNALPVSCIGKVKITTQRNQRKCTRTLFIWSYIMGADYRGF